MGWGEAVESLCRDQEFLDEWLEEADALHSDSEGEASQKTEGTDTGNRVWWADLLHQHAVELGYTLPDHENPIRIISCCSGAFAEGAVLEDRRLPK